MPTTTILGYLWRNRKDLPIDSIADALQLASDLARQGVPVVTLTDERILGQTTGHVYTQWVTRDSEEWGSIVSQAIIDAAVENALQSMHHDLGHEEDED